MWIYIGLCGNWKILDIKFWIDVFDDIIKIEAVIILNTDALGSIITELCVVFVKIEFGMIKNWFEWYMLLKYDVIDNLIEIKGDIDEIWLELIETIKIWW